MIFQFKADQNLVSEFYERDFDIFHFKAVQDLVAEIYERDFDVISLFKVDQNFGFRALWKIFWHDFPQGGSKLVAEHYERDFDKIFHFKANQNFL